MGLKTFFAASLLALRLLSPAQASPVASQEVRDVTERQSSSWWMADIQRQGTVAYGGGTGYTVFRNVMDYGATGDGTTDDTVAINAAITDGNRCGEGCDSSTVTPALVYFPPGTYLVSTPILQYYYTQLIGDAITVPTLKASASFAGIAVIDSNPPGSGGDWYTAQNNFFRQVRNFKIDLTGLPSSTGTGIHWRVAQATSLQNIEFDMVQDSSSANVQQGIFMEDGSGGYMGDLVFNGGKYGAWMGNQQFTVRNLQFNNCNTGIYVNWGWAWTFAGLEFNNCGIGMDLTSGGAADQSVGSVILLDSTFSGTPVGITTLYSSSQGTITNGTLIVENVDMSDNVPIAIQDPTTSTTILAGNQVIDSFIQGRVYNGADGGSAVQATQTAPTRPSALIDSTGSFVTRSKPQYTDVAASSFVSVKSSGAAGDGTTDDTAAIQAVFDSIGADDIVYFDHGAYLITDTVTVPSNVKIVGEIWPLIMAGGSSNFNDQTNPKPVFQIGSAGDTGAVEIQDIIFETAGPQPGAILMEFNVAGTSQAAAAMWDVHFRVGGSDGTDLQSNTCAKSPTTTNTPAADCFGSFLMVHITSSASVYMENNWMWTADHELDLSDHDQVTIYNGRGILIEATQGTWLWGTSSEHSVLQNYELSGAQNVYMGLIQTETAYYQGNPDATQGYTFNSAYNDPTFSTCTATNCARTWGLRILDSDDVFVYGAGLYSFFDNYDQTCLDTSSCQENMVDIQGSTAYIYGLSTKASTNMVSLNGTAAALDADNVNTFCACVALFEVA